MTLLTSPTRRPYPLSKSYGANDFSEIKGVISEICKILISTSIAVLKIEEPHLQNQTQSSTNYQIFGEEQLKFSSIKFSFSSIEKHRNDRTFSQLRRCRPVIAPRERL